MITNENFWFWFGGVWLAAGLLFLGVGTGVAVNQSSLAARLDARGESAVGVVLTKEIIAPDSGSDTYRVTFRFTDAHGAAIRGEADVAAEAWDELVERGPIDVVYLPDRPEIHRIRGQTGDDAVIAFVFPLIGAVLAGVGGFVVLNALRTRRRRALARNGASASATVIDVAPTNLRINGVSQWKLRYRFQDARGQAHEGASTLSPDEASSWKPGSIGRVRYDLHDPRAQLWTGEH